MVVGSLTESREQKNSGLSQHFCFIYSVVVVIMVVGVVVVLVVLFLLFLLGVVVEVALVVVTDVV